MVRPDGTTHAGRTPAHWRRVALIVAKMRDAAAALCVRWEHLPNETLHEFMRSVLVRAQVHADRIDLDVGPSRLVSGLLSQGADEGTVEGIRSSSANADGSEQTLIRLRIRASLKRTGKEMKFIVEGVTNSAPADTTLIRLLVRGQKIAKRMFGSNCPPLPPRYCAAFSLAERIEIDLAETREDHRVLKLSCRRIAGARERQSARVFECERASPAFGHDWTHDLLSFAGL